MMMNFRCPTACGEFDSARRPRRAVRKPFLTESVGARCLFIIKTYFTLGYHDILYDYLNGLRAFVATGLGGESGRG